jgi:hypothetical protein
MNFYGSYNLGVSTFYLVYKKILGILSPSICHVAFLLSFTKKKVRSKLNGGWVHFYVNVHCLIVVKCKIIILHLYCNNAILEHNPL